MKTDRHSLAFTRDVAKRTRRAGRAYVICSPKNGMVEIRVESRIEQAVVHALELDPRVVSYRAQPFTFNLTTGEVLQVKPKIKPKNAVYYTPDLVCSVHDVPIAIEVKHQDFVKENKVLFAKASTVAADNGLRFVLVTSADLPDQLQHNLRLLNQYAAQCRAQIPAWAKAVQGIALQSHAGTAAEVLKDLEPVNHHLAAGLLTGQIAVDLRKQALQDPLCVIAPAWGSLNALEVLCYD